MIGDAAAAFFEATVRTATPLALAALGETVTERAGLINLSLEGAIIAGAFGALAGAGAAGVGAGLLAATVAGVVVGGIFAAFAVGLRTDQIIAGTAITLLAFGVTGTLYRTLYESGAALTIPTLRATVVPGLASIPWIGRALFAQPLTTYAAFLLAPLIWWWMYRTVPGLSLRAAGDAPWAARASGASPSRLRTGAALFGGAMGGLSGGTLVLAQVGTFAEGMSAGRGFVAIAIVVLGRWHPLGALAAALLFGAASAMQYLFQAMAWPLPYQLFLALPYVLTLGALAVAGERGGARHGSPAPAALGMPDDGSPDLGGGGNRGT